jgi:methionyl-tRNA formyltransferase
MKTVFVGAVEGSAIALDALIDAGMAPGLVVTLPLELASRHSDFVDLEPQAQAGGSDLLRVADINSSTALDALEAFEPDLVLVIGWSQICKEKFRSIARLGNVGFHPAALPRLRGRAVIPWTILLGERTTGASLFWLDGGVDSGPILLQEPIAVADDETARSLYSKQTGALAKLLPRAIELIQAGDPPRIPQDESRAVYCAKRTAEDGQIDWHEPADDVVRLIRAVGDPYPGAFTAASGRRLFIDEASVFPDSHRYLGLVGQVQGHTSDGFIVRCGDGRCIHVTTWRMDGGRERPRVHAKLGAAAT